MSNATIDSLQIEIQSNSTSAASSIKDLAGALGELKKSGTITTAIKNLNGLSDALKNFAPEASNINRVRGLARALGELKKVGPVGSVGNSVSRLVESMGELNGANLDGVGPKIKQIVEAVAPLSTVKAGGLGTMVNALSKIDKVTDSLDETKIKAFADKIQRLSNILTPLSTKMTTIQTGLRGIGSSARTAGTNVKNMGDELNATSINMSSFINLVQQGVNALQQMAQKLAEIISQAIEWDGISARFGRGFGEQAPEVYAWIQRLNEEMGLNVQQFMQYSSIYATMLTGFGVAQEDAYKMALGYTELTYDIWAGYNDIYKTYEEAADAVRSAISGEVEPIRRAGFTIVESQLEQTAANYGLSISLEKATEAQKSYLRYLTLVDQAHVQSLIGTYAKEMNTAEGVMRTFSQQLKSLAQAFGSLFLPILVKVMPYVQAFVDLLTEAVHKVAAFFGVEIQAVDWSGYGSGMGTITEGAEEATDSIGGTTKALKELKNATLGIDELNIISPPEPSGGSSGGANGTNGFDGVDVGSLWDESIFDSINFQVDEIKSKLEEALKSITVVISGFMLAIGTILVVSGANIPLGLGLMAVGAVGLVATIAENWNSMGDELAKTLSTITSVIGGFLLAIGGFLVFSGVNVPLGAALMAAGAVSIATAATINWKFLDGDLKTTLSTLTAIVGGGLLAMGALFAFTGVAVPLGIGLMAAGAVSLATAVGLNWDSMSEPMRKAIGTLEAIVGGGLLAFGAILAFTGVNIPLGVGMIAAGAISLVSAVALNWGSLTGDLKNTLATIATIVGGALLGIGAILAFTGVATPLGIAMIAAGAISIIAAAGLNWSSIVDSIKNVVKELGIAVGGALLVIGCLLAFSGVALPLGIALIAVGAAGLVAGIALNWSAILDSIKNVVKELGIIVGGALLVLGVLLVFTGVGIPLGIGLIAAGAAGLVAGIALNWDAIKTAIMNAVNAVVDWIKKYGSLVLGLILCFSGVGIAPGIALIKQYMGQTNESGTTNWDALKDKIIQVWNSIKTWWDSKPALSEVIPVIGSIKEKLSSAWNTAKNWWDKSKTALKKYTPVIGSILGVLSPAWAIARNWWNSKKSGLNKYTPTIGSIKDKLVSAWNTAKEWWNKNVKLKIPSLSFKVTYSEATGLVRKAIVKALDLPGWPKLSFAASGGIFDTGSLIWAGERGPEVVANAAGGKTGVMNVQQMSDAVYEGVYAAVSAAMRSNGGNGGSQAVHVYLDGREITHSVEQRQKERGMTIMGNQVYSY